MRSSLVKRIACLVVLSTVVILLLAVGGVKPVSAASTRGTTISEYQNVGTVLRSFNYQGHWINESYPDAPAWTIHQHAFLVTGRWFGDIHQHHDVTILLAAVVGPSGVALGTIEAFWGRERHVKTDMTLTPIDHDRFTLSYYNEHCQRWISYTMVREYSN